MFLVIASPDPASESKADIQDVFWIFFIYCTSKQQYTIGGVGSSAQKSLNLLLQSSGDPSYILPIWLRFRGQCILSTMFAAKQLFFKS